MTTTLASAPTRSLERLVDDLDRAVRLGRPGRARVDAVVRSLRPALGDDRLLRPDQTVGDPTAYRQHLLHVAPDGLFSLVALVWLPGQATGIHDHLAWCVVGVHAGAEYEIRYSETPDGRLVETGRAVAGVGEAAGLLPPGDIHRVHNAGDGLAVSLHVYGTDISAVGSSIRRRYDESLVHPGGTGQT